MAHDPKMASAVDALQVQDLTFGYAERQSKLFDRWSHVFSRGLTWVTGADGTGKTTLLRLLSGALPGYSGQLTAMGHDERISPVDYRQEVFLCGPDRAQVSYLSPRDCFVVLRHLYPRFDVAALDRHATGFRLHDVWQEPIRLLSGAFQRKVWLAAALSVGCGAILMDDPMRDLDEEAASYLLQELDESSGDNRQVMVIGSREAATGLKSRSNVVHLG